MNITEDYVSFEIAKLLKEKGFDEKCQKVYMHNGQLLWAQIFMEGESFVDNKCIELVANYNDWITYIQGEYAYLCPTIQMAMKWLREKDIHILFEITEIQKNPKYYCVIWNTSTVESYIIDLFDSYEEAAGDAIMYCLENLI